MKKGLAVSIVQLAVVAAVLALTIASFAWYTSQSVVNTESVVITAEEAAHVQITMPPEDFEPYTGETGQGYFDPNNPELALDMPYTAIKRFTITFSPVKGSYAVCAYFTNISITKKSGAVVDVENDPPIMESFTFRLHIFDENTGNIACTLAPKSGTNNLVLTDNGDYGEIGEFLYIDSATTFECGFELIFLNESEYIKWLNEDYENVNAFRYHDYEYMRSTFSVTFLVGMNMVPNDE